MAAETQTDWAGYLNQFWTVLSPYAQQFVYGGQREDDNYTLTDANEHGRLNGAGAPDRAASQGAPRNTHDFLFGLPGTNAGTATSGAVGDNKKSALVLVGLIVAVWFFFFRK